MPKKWLHILKSKIKSKGKKFIALKLETETLMRQIIRNLQKKTCSIENCPKNMVYTTAKTIKKIKLKIFISKN